MAHGVSKAFADRFMVDGALVAGIVATVILLGMCGMRVQFIRIPVECTMIIAKIETFPLRIPFKPGARSAASALGR